MSEPVVLPEIGQSGLVFVLIFEILKLDLVAQCGVKKCTQKKHPALFDVITVLMQNNTQGYPAKFAG